MPPHLRLLCAACSPVSPTLVRTINLTHYIRIVIPPVVGVGLPQAVKQPLGPVTNV